jgi:hypothetical protein
MLPVRSTKIHALYLVGVTVEVLFGKCILY